MQTLRVWEAHVNSAARMPPALGLAAMLLVASALAACGDDDAPEPPAERADAPAKPPSGWRTVENETAGFTIAAPRTWPAATKRGATLIRSKDELVAVTIAADRSTAGRQTQPATYARQVVAALPGFQGGVSVRDSEIAGSRYETALAVGAGTIKTSGVPQRIQVAVFHRPRRVTYSAVIFRNAKARPVPGRGTVARILRSFRAQPPRR